MREIDGERVADAIHFDGGDGLAGRTAEGFPEDDEVRTHLGHMQGVRADAERGPHDGGVAGAGLRGWHGKQVTLSRKQAVRKRPWHSRGCF